MRVSTDGQTHASTHAQTQNDFIICTMLYAIAMGQIKISIENMLATAAVRTLLNKAESGRRG